MPLQYLSHQAHGLAINMYRQAKLCKEPPIPFTPPPPSLLPSTHPAAEGNASLEMGDHLVQDDITHVVHAGTAAQEKQPPPPPPPPTPPGIHLSATQTSDHLVQDDIEGLSHIFHVQVAAHGFALAMDGQIIAAAGKQREFGDQLLWKLVGPVDIVAPGDDDGHLVAGHVGLGHHLCSCLGC